MGPHTFNFAQAAQWAEQAGAARRVSDMRSGIQTALDWMAKPDALNQARANCLTFASAHQGASQKTAEAVLAVLRESERTVPGSPPT